MTWGYSQETCPHSETRQVWVEEEDAWSGEDISHWEDKWESWDVDIDIHRFKCTRCGRIGYYSGAARAFYEDGKRSPGIRGLE
jgi:hypothetical protein